MQSDRATERVTVTLPVRDAQRLRRMVEAGELKSVSSFVADAVHDRLARDESLGRLRGLWGELPDEALAEARRAFGVTGERPARAS